MKKPILGWVLGACICANAWPSEAPFISTGDEISYLGLREADFVPLVANIKRISRPLKGPRGELGKWTKPGELYLGQPFVNTYFVERGKVSRIEKSWASSSAECGSGQWFETAIQQINQMHGEGQLFYADIDSRLSPRSAMWVIQEAQVSLFGDMTPGKCSMRLVFKPNVTNDGSEL